MSVFDDLFKIVFPIILPGLESLADGWVDGSELKKDQKQLLLSGYVLLNTHADDLVESTENEYDDEGLMALSDFCKDTLAEAGIDVDSDSLPEMFEKVEEPPVEEDPPE